MKQTLILLLLAFFTGSLHAQNVGIGLALPQNKLQVGGNLVVTEPAVGTNAAPTPAQTQTMVNAAYSNFNSSDSIGRIYDPGGPTGNYLPNLTAGAGFQCCPTNQKGMEIIIESINLGTGDSLIIRQTSDPQSDVYLAVGNGYNTPGRFVFNGQYFYLLFKSNNDASVGSGFSILLKRLYSSFNNLPELTGFTGNSLLFDVRNGSLRAGAPGNDNRGAYSAAFGEGSRANSHSFATGFYSNASGGYAIATGSATASGYYSAAFSSGNASGSRATAFCMADATGTNSFAAGSGLASGGISLAMGGSTEAAGSYSAALNNRTISMGYAGTTIGMYNNPLLFAGQTSATDNTPLFIIGNGDNESNLSNAMVVRKDGKVGIGANTPVTRLHIEGGTDASVADASGYLVTGPVNAGNLVFDNNEIMARNNGAIATLHLQNDGGALEIGGTAAKPGGGAWLATSDARLKQTISPYTDGLPQLLKINPVNFYYNQKSGYDTTQHHVGVLAQELKEVSPYMVSGFTKDGTEYYKVDNSAMTYMLINAVKALQKTNELLEEKIKKLEEKVSGKF